MTEKVTLIIKAANQSSEDQKLECDLNWKVLSLKEEISKTHPGKPSVKEQRLIYSGQLLQDSFDLRTVLRHPSDNNEYTIHMVCSTLKSPSAARMGQSSNMSSSASNTTTNAEVTPESNNDGLRHRATTSEQIPAFGVQQGFDTSLYSTFTQPFPPQAITDPIQQMEVMQQMYAQYMASYMQYMQSARFEGGRMFQDPMSPTPGLSTPAGSSVSDSENQENNVRPQPQVPNAQEPQRNAQDRLIQGGAAVEEEEEGGARDWLDYIYFASRMGVLLSIVYFYSTFTRFLVVAGISIIFYLYQGGVLRQRRLEVQQQQEPVPQPPPLLVNQGDDENGAQPNDAPPQPSAQPEPSPEENSGGNASSHETLQQEGGLGGEEGDEEEEGIREGGESTLEGGSGSNVEGAPNASAEGQQQQPPSTRNPIIENLPPPPQQPSLLSLSWTLLTTFFTSLIPEQHQII